MPITKERLSEITTTARILLDSHDAIHQKALTLTSGDITESPVDKLLELFDYIVHKHSQIPRHSAESVVREETHFKLTHKHNERKKWNLRLKRQTFTSEMSERTEHYQKPTTQQTLEARAEVKRQRQMQGRRQSNYDSRSSEERMKTNSQIAFASIGETQEQIDKDIARVIEDMQNQGGTEVRTLNQMPETLEDETSVKTLIMEKDGEEVIVTITPDPNELTTQDLSTDELAMETETEHK